MSESEKVGSITMVEIESSFRPESVTGRSDTSLHESQDSETPMSEYSPPYFTMKDISIPETPRLGDMSKSLRHVLIGKKHLTVQKARSYILAIERARLSYQATGFFKGLNP